MIIDHIRKQQHHEKGRADSDSPFGFGAVALGEWKNVLYQSEQ